MKMVRQVVDLGMEVMAGGNTVPGPGGHDPIEFHLAAEMAFFVETGLAVTAPATEIKYSTCSVSYQRSFPRRHSDIPGLVDYRIILDRNVVDRLHDECVVAGDDASTLAQVREKLLQLPAIGDSLATRRLTLATLHLVTGLAAAHAVKRTILDLRDQGEKYAVRS